MAEEARRQYIYVAKMLSITTMGMKRSGALEHHCKWYRWTQRVILRLGPHGSIKKLLFPTDFLREFLIRFFHNTYFIYQRNEQNYVNSVELNSPCVVCRSQIIILCLNWWLQICIGTHSRLETKILERRPTHIWNIVVKYILFIYAEILYTELILFRKPYTDCPCGLTYKLKKLALYGFRLPKNVFISVHNDKL